MLLLLFYFLPFILLLVTNSKTEIEFLCTSHYFSYNLFSIFTVSISFLSGKHVQYCITIVVDRNNNCILERPFSYSEGRMTQHT